MTDHDKRPAMQLWWHLYVDCPKCGTTTDAAEHDSGPEIAVDLFSNNWKGIEGRELVCPECDHEFQVGEVTY